MLYRFRLASIYFLLFFFCVLKYLGHELFRYAPSSNLCPSQLYLHVVLNAWGAKLCTNERVAPIIEKFGHDLSTFTKCLSNLIAQLVKMIGCNTNPFTGSFYLENEDMF